MIPHVYRRECINFLFIKCKECKYNKICIKANLDTKVSITLKCLGQKLSNGYVCTYVPISCCIYNASVSE